MRIPGTFGVTNTKSPSWDRLYVDLHNMEIRLAN
jgi:hypothetical protein